MKFPKVFLIALIFLFNLSAQAHLEKTRSDTAQGGMIAGGGGDTLGPSQIGEDKISGLLSQARREVYMQLALESKNPHFPWPQLFTGSPNIFDFIARYKIYEKGPCEDKFGHGKDGSMYSPTPDAICIDAHRLGTKLSPSSARAQTLALVAHEYSHLKGFNESQAVALQKYLLSVYADSSSKQSSDLLDSTAQELFKIRAGIFQIQSLIDKSTDWNTLCYNSQKLSDSMKNIELNSTSEPYSVFDKKLQSTQDSFYILQTAMTWQACAFGSLDPHSQLYQPYISRWFSAEKQISVSKVAKDVVTDYDIRQRLSPRDDIVITKIETMKDYKTQLSLFQNYALDELTKQLLLLGRLGTIAR